MTPSRRAAEKHELKTDPEVFDAVQRGEKTFEIRKADRDFQVGDTLILQRTKFTGKQMSTEGYPLIYTGETIAKPVTHILHGPIYGLEKGWCIMSISSDYAQEMKEAREIIADFADLKHIRHYEQERVDKAQAWLARNPEGVGV